MGNTVGSSSGQPVLVTSRPFESKMCKSLSPSVSITLQKRLAYLLLIVQVMLIICEGKLHVDRYDCIPVTECPLYDQYLRAIPRTASHIAAVRSAHCGFEKLVEKVWCPIIVDIEEEDGHVGTLTSRVTIPKQSPSPTEDKDILKTRAVEPALPTAAECGNLSENKILGGDITDIDEFPWTAMLFYRPQRRRKALVAKCGGTLISRRYVVTAAHCITHQLTMVVLGEYDTRNETDCIYHTEDNLQCAPKPLQLRIEKVIPYPQLADEPVYVNDIALLKLEKDVEFNDYVAPICLPTKATSYPKSGSPAFATGWGRWGFTVESEFSMIKQKVGIPIASRENCSISQGINITSTMLCAGGVKNKDTCQGDSGGPLMQIDLQTTNWNLIGIVSVSTKTCGTDGVPAVYTWLPAYIDWIYENVQ